MALSNQKAPNKVKLEIDYKKSIETILKDRKGDPSKKKLSITINLKAKNNKDNILVNKNFYEEFSYAVQSDKFNMSQYEDNIINNLNNKISTSTMGVSGFDPEMMAGLFAKPNKIESSYSARLAVISQKLAQNPNRSDADALKSEQEKLYADLRKMKEAEREEKGTVNPSFDTGSAKTYCPAESTTNLSLFTEKDPFLV